MGGEQSDSGGPKLYTELASWWPLLSPPEDYAGEAEFIRETLWDACDEPPQTLLELGSGGGSNASHLKEHFRLTLADVSAGMLEVSRGLNPECEHVEGDMRKARLGRLFDCVMIHDAVLYMTTEQDLRRAMETAFVHCRPGGAAIFLPDYVRENFRPATEHGGQDGAGRALRYLEWTWDPDPTDNTYVGDYVFVLREPDGAVQVVHDRHVEGLFGRGDWLRLLRGVGFRPEALTDPWEREVFVATRPRGAV